MEIVLRRPLRAEHNKTKKWHTWILPPSSGKLPKAQASPEISLKQAQRPSGFGQNFRLPRLLGLPGKWANSWGSWEALGSPGTAVGSPGTPWESGHVLVLTST
ncbi:hypothetical protein BT96DRAFT_1038995 [Gymnopus androsaceus JB14]|uniref:Uncharacterized protein n=1 Tax=Gymnopus androsaceus JB14 TaxID=1447944 RepID=A0A6A4HE68_9AGAR|nr:hypothetical protein BT96DRAFT_1038995 [Gymnopus androsaceus JB14]